MSLYDEKNLPVAYSANEDEYKEIVEEPLKDIEEEEDELPENDEVYDLPEPRSDRNRIWSILSLILGIVSIALSPVLYFLAIPLSIVSIMFAAMSRKKFGFFTRLTLIGMIVSIVGIVCGVSFTVANVFDLI